MANNGIVINNAIEDEHWFPMKGMMFQYSGLHASGWMEKVEKARRTFGPFQKIINLGEFINDSVHIPILVFSKFNFCHYKAWPEKCVRFYEEFGSFGENSNWGKNSALYFLFPYNNIGPVHKPRGISSIHGRKANSQLLGVFCAICCLISRTPLLLF